VKLEITLYKTDGNYIPNHTVTHSTDQVVTVTALRKTNPFYILPKLRRKISSLESDRENKGHNEKEDRSEILITESEKENSSYFKLQAINQPQSEQ
jgi:hypothetical protein